MLLFLVSIKVLYRDGIYILVMTKLKNVYTLRVKLGFSFSFLYNLKFKARSFKDFIAIVFKIRLFENLVRQGITFAPF
ncbi:MAG: hypothetical protein CMF37_01015 [Leeuwenhoekiella sp.]|nr:hypothetical protein [Leeuwenhoekiella sp.]